MNNIYCLSVLHNSYFTPICKFEHNMNFSCTIHRLLCLVCTDTDTRFDYVKVCLVDQLNHSKLQTLNPCPIFQSPAVQLNQWSIWPLLMKLFIHDVWGGGGRTLLPKSKFFWDLFCWGSTSLRCGHVQNKVSVKQSRNYDHQQSVRWEHQRDEILWASHRMMRVVIISQYFLSNQMFNLGRCLCFSVTSQLKSVYIHSGTVLWGILSQLYFTLYFYSTIFQR